MSQGDSDAQPIAPPFAQGATGESKIRRVFAEVKIVDPPKKPAFKEFGSHPLFVTAIGFVLTGLLGTYFTTYLNTWTHERDRQTSLRENAIAAVEDISELVNERRIRASMLASSIKRGAPESEASARKIAYDESLVRWNAKLPGDVLRMRVGLAGAHGGEAAGKAWEHTHYEKYIDALADANVLSRLNDSNEGPKEIEKVSPGLFAIIDDCLTKASDLYRKGGYSGNESGIQVLKSCNFDDLKMQSLYCFATIAESIYRAVNEIGVAQSDEVDSAVTKVCQPRASGP